MTGRDGNSMGGAGDATTAGRRDQSSFDVELVDVSKEYGGVRAVEELSLAVLRGEFISVLGPSGCGKTTTLRMIAGLEEPTSGEILFRGRRAGDMPAYKRPTNTVFQSYALFPHMSVAENIAYGLTIQKHDKREIQRKVGQLLELVQLSGHETRYPDQLSGGEQQRVALARALARDPAVLLLDEPLGALDLMLRRAMQVELKILHEQVGITFIYVTHDQEEALAMSDRVAVMNMGRLIQMGTPRELFEEPKTRFVAEFIGENNVLPSKLMRKENDRMLVDTEIGPMCTQSTVAEEDDQNYYVCIRADQIVMGRAAADRQYRYDAVVEESIYRGTTIKWLVRLPSGHGLTVSTSIGVVLEQAWAGASIDIGWDPEAVRLVTE